MPRRVIISSIVLVLLSAGWTIWPRQVPREVSTPVVLPSTPSAVDEAGADESPASVSSEGSLTHTRAQLTQDKTALKPQPQRARSNVQVQLRTSVRSRPQESATPHSPQEGLTNSLRQVAVVTEDTGTGLAASGLGVELATKDGDLKPLDTGTGTLGESTPARVPILRPPVLLVGPPPEYPSNGYQVVLNRSSLTPRLKVEATEGRVILRLLVLAAGGVDRVEVSVSSDVKILDQAAATAVLAWRFAPATRDGQAIDAWVVVPIRFVVR